jgi:hypothetical protein
MISDINFDIGLNASRIETPSVPVVGQRASEDESNEGSEGSRVLTPEEVRDFRSRMSIGKSNGRANGAIKKSAKASNQYLFTCITLIVLALAVFAAYMMMNNSLKDQLLSKVSELTQAVKAMYDRYQLPQKKSVEDSVGSL